MEEEELEGEEEEEEKEEEVSVGQQDQCLLTYTGFTTNIITLLQVWRPCALQSECWGEEKKRNDRVSDTMHSDSAVCAEPLLLQLYIATVVRVLRSQISFLRL